MPALLSGLLAGLALLSVARGQRPATNGEFPFHVSIHNASNNNHLCGGVIITSKWILTVRECAMKSTSILVGYGSADSNQPTEMIKNRRIIYDNAKADRISPLALVELDTDISFSETAKKASLPIKGAELKSSRMKLIGWKIDTIMHKHPSLSVIDNFMVNYTQCQRPTGTPLPLGSDYFCGYNGDYPDYFNLETSLGTVVAKSGVIVGLLPERPDFMVFPVVFVKVSEYDDWIRNILGNDYNNVSWTESIPKDAAGLTHVSTLLTVVVSLCLPRFI